MASINTAQGRELTKLTTAFLSTFTITDSSRCSETICTIVIKISIPAPHGIYSRLCNPLLFCKRCSAKSQVLHLLASQGTE